MTILTDLEKEALLHLKEILDQGGVFDNLVETVTTTEEIFHACTKHKVMNSKPSRKVVTTVERKVTNKKHIPDYILRFFLNKQEVNHALSVLERNGYQAIIDDKNKQSLETLREQLDDILKDADNSPINQGDYQDFIEDTQREFLGI
jgi:hypothetical protein